MQQANLTEVNRLKMDNHNLRMQMGELSDKLSAAREENRTYRDALEYLVTAIMPEERKYDQQFRP